MNPPVLSSLNLMSITPVPGPVAVGYVTPPVGVDDIRHVIRAEDPAPRSLNCPPRRRLLLPLLLVPWRCLEDRCELDFRRNDDSVVCRSMR